MNLSPPIAPDDAPVNDEPARKVVPPANDGEHGDQHHGPPPWRRLMSLLHPESRDIWTVVAFAAGVGVLGLATPVAVESLVNTVSFGIVLQPVIVLAIVLLCCLSLAAVFRGLQAYVAEIIQRRLFLRVAGDLAFRLPRASMQAFDGRHGPELVNRFFDVLTVQKSGTLLLLEGVSVVMQACVAMLLLAFYHPFLLGFVAVLMSAIAFVVFGMGRGGVRTSIHESIAKYQLAEWLEELARHPAAFKHTGGAEFAWKRTDSLAEDFLTARERHYRVVLRQLVGSLTLQVLASTALLGLGGYLVIERQLTLGQLVAAELMLTAIVVSIVKLGKQLESFYDLMAAVDKLGMLADLPLEIDAGEDAIDAAGPAGLRFCQVGFAFDERRPVLADFNLEVKPGERLAVVGDGGAGKSLLLDLIFALRRPDRGFIELDGVDLRDLSLASLRRQVALVKHPELFAGTLAENVSLGRPGISLADVRDAVAAVGLQSEVAALPDGLQTQLVTGGAPLSSSQALRVGLARAIVGRPRVLLLDETLDALDVAARRRVLDSAFAPSAPWTLLAATQDPEVAARCTGRLQLPNRQTKTRSPS